jgi:hypothetical protein
VRFALVVAFASCLAGTSSAQRADDEPIRVILPPEVDDATCHVDSQISGPIHITFRALAACPGYRIWTAVDALPEPGHRRINAALEPSPKIRFSGVIRGWATPTVRYRVHIVHFPGWKCTFFRRSDCMLAMWTLARVPVAADGTFSAELPDLANDPVFKSFGSSADVLRLGLREVSTLNRAFELRPLTSGTINGGVAIAAHYRRNNRSPLFPFNSGAGNANRR